MNMKSGKNKAAVSLLVVLLILFAGGMGIWAKNNYNHIVNNEESMEKTKSEIRDQYIDTLYKNHELTENDARQIIINSDAKTKYNNFTESKPEEFIAGTVQSYKIDNQSLSLQIKDENNQLIEKTYDINDVSLVDISDKNTFKLEASGSKVNLQDGSSVELKDKKIYVVINEVNNNNQDKDDVFIAMN